MLGILALAIAPQPQPPEPADAVVTVVGKRFDQTRGIIKQNVVTGRSTCTVTRSRGDAAIDQGVCEVGMACMGRTRKNASFKRCLAEGRERFLDNYFAAKERARATN